MKSLTFPRTAAHPLHTATELMEPLSLAIFLVTRWNQDLAGTHPTNNFLHPVIGHGVMDTVLTYEDISKYSCYIGESGFHVNPQSWYDKNH